MNARGICTRFFLLVLFLLPAWQVQAAWTPEDIPEAPIEDETASEIEAAPETIPQPSSSADQRWYWIGTYEFSPETDSPVEGPLAWLRNQTSMRSSRLEMNGEWAKMFSDQFFFKADMQADYWPENSEDDSGSVRLNELFLDYHLAPGFSLLAGKYRRVFGPGMFQNPMDRHTPAAFLPGQPLQREGAYLLQLTWTSSLETDWLSDALLSAAFLPGVLQNDYGLPTAEVSYVQVNPAGSIRREYEAWSAGRLGGFVRGYGNLANGDANVMVYFYESQWQLGASYNRYLISPWLELHAEGLGYRQPHDMRELDASLYWDAVAGIRIEPWSLSGLIVEWIHSSERLEAVPAAGPRQRQLLNNFFKPGSHLTAAMPFQNYLTLTAYGPVIQDRLTLRANAVVHPSSGDSFWTLRSDLAVGNQAQWSLTGMLISGPAGGYYSAVIPFPWRATTELWIYF